MDLCGVTSQIIIFQEFLFCVDKVRVNQAASSCSSDILEEKLTGASYK